MIVLNTGMYSLLYMYILTRNSDLNRWSLIYFLQMDEYECSRNHVNESQQPKNYHRQRVLYIIFTTG